MVVLKTQGVRVQIFGVPGARHLCIPEEDKYTTVAYFNYLELSLQHFTWNTVPRSEYVGMDRRKETDIPIESSAAGS